MASIYANKPKLRAALKKAHPKFNTKQLNAEVRRLYRAPKPRPKTPAAAPPGPAPVAPPIPDPNAHRLENTALFDPDEAARQQGLAPPSYYDGGRFTNQPGA